MDWSVSLYVTTLESLVVIGTVVVDIILLVCDMILQDHVIKGHVTLLVGASRVSDHLAKFASNSDIIV